MMTTPLVEFLIPKRPVSLQTKKASRLNAWKAFVATQARQAWTSASLDLATELQLTLVYLCGDAPVDADNIVKPIQDALIGIVYADDSCICDVVSRRRRLSGTIDLTNLPGPLIDGVEQFAKRGDESVYLRIDPSPGWTILHECFKNE